MNTTIGYTDQIEISVEHEIISAVYHWGDGTKSICTISMRENGFTYKGDVPLGGVTGLVLQYMNLKAAVSEEATTDGDEIDDSFENLLVDDSEEGGFQWRNCTDWDDVKGNPLAAGVYELATRVIDTSKKYSGDTCVRNVKDVARHFMNSIDATNISEPWKNDLIRIAELLISGVKYGATEKTIASEINKFERGVRGVSALHAEIR